MQMWALAAAVGRKMLSFLHVFRISRNLSSVWTYRGMYYGYQAFYREGLWCAADANQVKERDLYSPPSTRDNPPGLLFASSRKGLEKRIRRAEEENFARDCGKASREELAGGPNFFIMAPSRSGTTWLARLLSGHPEVLLPAEKEMDFFSFMHQVYDLRTYCRKFAAPPAKARGEASPTYAGLPKAAIKYIHECFPQLKLLWLFRDPVQRAWSYIRMQYCNGGSVDDLQAVRMYLLRDRDILFFGDYATCIRQWLDAMPRKSFHVELLEAADTDLAGMLKRSCRFLGIDPTSQLSSEDAAQHVNQGEPMALSPEALHLLQQAYRRNLRSAQVLLADRFGLDVTKHWDMSPLDAPSRPLLLEENRNGFLTFLYDSDYYGIEIAPPGGTPLQSLEQVSPAMLAEMTAGPAMGATAGRAFFRQACYFWLVRELDGYEPGREWPLVPAARDARRDYELGMFLRTVPWQSAYHHTIIENCRRHYVAFWRGEVVGVPHDLLAAQADRPVDDVISDGLASGSVLRDRSADALLRRLEAMP